MSGHFSDYPHPPKMAMRKNWCKFMATFMSFVMWGIVGIATLLFVMWFVGLFVQENDKADAYKHLAEKERQKKDH
jgi:hypothetical protein